ncbi:MAG: hypothetical protein ACRD4B_06635, partial [Acidobacteriota bacterium]
HRVVNRNLNMRQKIDEFKSIAKRHLNRPAAYLAMTIRSHAFADPHATQSIKSNVAWLLGHRDVSRFRFTFPENATRILKSNEIRE